MNKKERDARVRHLSRLIRTLKTETSMLEKDVRVRKEVMEILQDEMNLLNPPKNKPKAKGK